MTKRRKEDGFNLAFLDVMACGLGAVLLILIVVKFNADTPIPNDEIERLQQELNSLSQLKAELDQNLSGVDQSLAQASKSAVESAQNIANLRLQQQGLNQAIDEQKAVIADLEQAVAAAAPLVADDTLETVESAEENYLLGLKIEGKRIGILIDTSASMTDESLLDIIKRKVQNDVVKQQGPKWQRTKRIAKWMLARLPKQSEVTVLSFNTTTTFLGDDASSGNFNFSATDKDKLESIVDDIEDLVPKEGTNLQIALQDINKAIRGLTHLYIITDGLPTKLTKGSGFAPSRKCKPSDASQKTITGECRFKVFQHTFARFAPRVETNIVLLPLEGDSQAPSAYWNWANSSGGLLISPAGTWP